MSTDVRAPINYRDILNPKPTMILFNPGRKPMEFDCSAETFVIPAGGTLAVADLPGHYNPKSKNFDNHILAKEIVTFAVGEDGISGRVGKRGVRMITDDHETNERIKVDARAACVEADYYVALHRKQSHMSINAKERDAGVATTPPSKETREAMQFIEEYEAEVNPQSEFACGECSWPFHEERSRNAHIVAQHRESAAKYGLSGGFQALQPGAHAAEVIVPSMATVKEAALQSQMDALLGEMAAMQERFDARLAAMEPANAKPKRKAAEASDVAE